MSIKFKLKIKTVLGDVYELPIDGLDGVEMDEDDYERIFETLFESRFVTDVSPKNRLRGLAIQTKHVVTFEIVGTVV